MSVVMVETILFTHYLPILWGFPTFCVESWYSWSWRRNI